MAGRRRSRAGRLHVVLVVTGLTLGILILFGLQFLIPYLLGPAGLLVVFALDAAIFLAFHRRAHARKPARRPSPVVWGPVDRRYVSRERDSLQREVAADFVFLVFLVAVYVVGSVIYNVSAVIENVPILIFGGVMVGIVVWPLRSYIIEYALLTPESEKYDTTEDH